jgi:hypothetical protein
MESQQLMPSQLLAKYHGSAMKNDAPWRYKHSAKYWVLQL